MLTFAATDLVRELKKLDDKDVIVDVQLEESKACYMLNNLAKARGALISARTTANSIYIQARQQAALDMQSGTVHRRVTVYSLNCRRAPRG